MILSGSRATARARAFYVSVSGGYFYGSHFLISRPPSFASLIRLFPELSRKSSCILYTVGVYGSIHFAWPHPLRPPRAPQGLPNAPPPADPGRAQDIALRWWDPVMTDATFHAHETCRPALEPHANGMCVLVLTNATNETTVRLLTARSQQSDPSFELQRAAPNTS